MSKKEYSCIHCGQVYKQWVGKCTQCNEWNCVKEKSGKSNVSFTTLQAINTITLDEKSERYSTEILELDRVLGGGFISGTAILLSGEPGIGKSTLLLQLCDATAKKQLATCYVTGEESLNQVTVRARRMNIKSNIKAIATNDLEEILSILKTMKSPGIMVIDSIQTIGSKEVENSIGSIGQVKTCTLELVNAAKMLGICIVIVGHINKEGQIAGPKLLEHMVDVVLSFESDNTKQYRIIRGLKNRYGSTNEMGIFEMSSNGLLDVQNPSKIFMQNRNTNISGSCVFAGIEGTRGVLVEVQALVAPSYIPTPKRAAIGWDHNRLTMMIAILNARIGINLMDKEVYLNVAGGTKINDIGLDLAVVVALLSAHKKVAIKNDTVFVGEVGLSGEIRGVSHLDARIKEAMKLGFKRVVAAVPDKMKTNSNLIDVKHIKDLLPLITK